MEESKTPLSSHLAQEGTERTILAFRFESNLSKTYSHLPYAQKQHCLSIYNDSLKYEKPSTSYS